MANMTRAGFRLLATFRSNRAFLTKTQTCRALYTNPRICQNEKPGPASDDPCKGNEHSVGIGMESKLIHLTPLNKKYMVWSKMYPSIDEVPDTASYLAIQNAKDRLRTRLAIFLTLLTAVVSAVTILFSRREAKKRRIAADPIRNRQMIEVSSEPASTESK